jgi:hypothetical protein
VADPLGRGGYGFPALSRPAAVSPPATGGAWTTAEIQPQKILLDDDGTKRRAGRFGREVLLMTVARTNKSKAPNVAAPDPKAVEAIGRALKAHYADLVHAPLPEKFVELLARFEDGDQAPEPKGGLDAIG